MGRVQVSGPSPSRRTHSRAPARRPPEPQGDPFPPTRGAFSHLSPIQETGSPLPSGQPRFPALLLLILRPAPPGNYRSASSAGPLPTPAAARRPALESGRKLLTPPARAPGRTPGRGVPAPRPRPEAEPLAPALPRSLPLSPGKFPALHSLRTGAAPAHAAPSRRRLPHTTPLPASPCRPSPRASPGPGHRPGHSRPREPSAARRRHPRALRRPSAPRRRRRRVTHQPAPAYNLAPQALQHLGPPDCPHPRPQLLPSQSPPALRRRRRSTSKRRRRHGAARPLPQPRRLRSRARRSPAAASAR
nr:vegetative cell wall protein gp1-like [Camelus dromedarius]